MYKDFNFSLLCFSALVVRFVTGRFLNEYDPTLGKERSLFKVLQINL